MIICRCEEITLEEVLDAIHHGAADVDAVKRMTRAGMGLCQGKTCSTLITQLIAAELNIPPGEVRQSTQRRPVRPVPADIIGQ